MRTYNSRILFCIFQTSNCANGGVESITQIIEGLQHCRKFIITNMETPVSDRWREIGAEVVVWKLPYKVGDRFLSKNPVKFIRRLSNMLASNWRTFRFLKKNGIQVVHCNDPAPLLHVAPAARLCGIPVVLNLRDTKASVNELDSLKYRLRFRFCDKILVLSSEMKKFYQQVYPELSRKRQAKIEYIYSIVDSERLRPPDDDERVSLRRNYGIPEDTFAIGYVAAFNDKKNQLDFIRNAGALLKKSAIPVKIYFLGDFNPDSDNYARACRDAVQQSDLDDLFIFTGFVKDIHDWYRALDLVVLASRHEGLARSMIESLACGTPVVSFDVASAREILEEYQCGIVIKQSDYKGLVEAIMEYAEDSRKREDAGNKGARMAHLLLNKETIIEQFESLYDESNPKAD